MTVKFIIPLAVHLCVILVSMMPLHGAEKPEDGKAVGAPGPHMVEFPSDSLSEKEQRDIYTFHIARLQSENREMKNYLGKKHTEITIMAFLAEQDPQKIIDSHFFRTKSNPKL